MVRRTLLSLGLSSSGNLTGKKSRLVSIPGVSADQEVIWGQKGVKGFSG